MSTIVAVPVAPEPVQAAASQRPVMPPRDSIEPPGRPAAEARRADARGERGQEAARDFATALAGEMARDGGETASVPAERTGAPPAAPGVDDGDDAPSSGNGLPPWLLGLPLAPVPANAAPAAAGALAASGPADRSTPEAGASAVLPQAPAAPASSPLAAPDAADSADVLLAAAAAPVVATGAAAATTAAIPPSPAPKDDAPADPPGSVPLPNDKALPAQARAAGPSPAEPALQHSTRFAAASPPIAPADGLGAAASEIASSSPPALGREPTVSPATPGAPSAAAAERRPAPGPPLATTPLPGADAPVATLLPQAVSAALAADAESSSDLALPPPSPSLAPPAAPLPAAGPPGSTPALQIAVAVGAPDWDRQLGERVGVLVDQGLTNAQLKLSPAHLGPLEIRISVQNDQANVWFGTHSHATREALEAAAPRLRDLLGAQGFAHVGVSVDLQQQAARQNAPASRYEPEFSFAAGDSAAIDATRATRPAAAAAAARSRIDAFA